MPDPDEPAGPGPAVLLPDWRERRSGRGACWPGRCAAGCPAGSGGSWPASMCSARSATSLERRVSAGPAPTCSTTWARRPARSSWPSSAATRPARTAWSARCRRPPRCGSTRTARRSGGWPTGRPGAGAAECPGRLDPADSSAAAPSAQERQPAARPRWMPVGAQQGPDGLCGLPGQQLDVAQAQPARDVELLREFRADGQRDREPAPDRAARGSAGYAVPRQHLAHGQVGVQCVDEFDLDRTAARRGPADPDRQALVVRGSQDDAARTPSRFPPRPPTAQPADTDRPACPRAPSGGPAGSSARASGCARREPAAGPVRCARVSRSAPRSSRNSGPAAGTAAP